MAEIHGELTAQFFYEKCDYHVTDGPSYEDGAPVVKLNKRLNWKISTEFGAFFNKKRYPERVSKSCLPTIL